MDVSHLLDSLNKAQREAVAAPPGHLLVLAGAGSGKTRVLVHRIAWYVQTGQAGLRNVLAVTFTNKAAAEMRSRIESLLGVPAAGLWVGTFHGIAHRLLRTHWQEAGLAQNFQILDSDDQQRSLRRVIRNLGLDEARWPAREAQWFINARKEEGLRPGHLESVGDPNQAQMIRIYEAYEALCAQAGLVDFAELLLRLHEMWRDHAGLLEHYRERFRHVLVDEFQDTNAIQYAWLRRQVGPANTLFVVGDDDQSIYSWRGARVEHMRRFADDFPGSRLLRLEQNYRSTGNILAAANALIAHNSARLGKQLWTEDGEGDPLLLYCAFNDREEARFVVEKIQDWRARGRRYREAAVLYRVSAQSRLFEEALLQAGVPYRVYGGLRFYERAEVKDALAYLRLVHAPDNDTAFERAVNNPPRGIGERTLEAVRQRARASALSLWRAAEGLVASGELPARAATALKGFLDLIRATRAEVQGRDLGATMEQVVAASGLRQHYEKDKGERGQARVENLDELISAAQEFDAGAAMTLEGEALEEDPLAAYLAHAALEAGEAQGDPFQDCVQLMTLHSAKGLEFPLVFLVGLEEGLFPHQLSSHDAERLEEERRLCYVGMTRARERLILTHAESRRLHGQELFARLSRFVRELPSGLVAEVRLGGEVMEPRRGEALSSRLEEGLRLGQRVLHAKFGEGVILELEGRGAQARVQVNFERAGTKWLVAAYAGLEAVY